MSKINNNTETTVNTTTQNNNNTQNHPSPSSELVIPNNNKNNSLHPITTTIILNNKNNNKPFSFYYTNRAYKISKLAQINEQLYPLFQITSFGLGFASGIYFSAPYFQEKKFNFIKSNILRGISISLASSGVGLVIGGIWAICSVPYLEISLKSYIMAKNVSFGLLKDIDTYLYSEE